MARAAKRAGRRIKQNLFSRLPSDTISDILLRLPAKYVLRAGAVCKAWRSVTTEPSFLAAHARLQPAQVVLYTYMDVGCYQMALDVVPVSPADDEAARRCLLHYPRIRSLLLLASCNGVLLFRKSEGCILLCNPTTRQWAQLPQLSREPRSLHGARSWFILATGAAEPRQVNMLAETSLTNSLATAPPLALNGRLHWPPSQTTATEMLVFDTLSEMFHQMAGPPTATAGMAKLFDMEGLLAAADFGNEKHVGLWFLEDYNAGRWERRHRVAAAWQPTIYREPPRKASGLVRVAAAADGEGNIVLGSHIWFEVYNVRTRTARTVNLTAPNMLMVSRHVFSESLVRHSSFATRSAADLGVTFSWA
ncbi:F-box protein [Panicum miliaceum]|uniref:F-box protein n=1 Tax=Panicum miliaceum TaxID=4540 RepID=A0A3L6T7E0_PANMI|nr:F-box protein [Panicum miliaceum]